MKHLTSKKFIILILVNITLFTLTQSRSLSSNKSACSISTISIPLGTNTPVMIYNARMENDNLKLTVLEKEHINKYNVEGNLFYTDKTTGESWYANKNVDEKSLESMRDAFSLCRIFHSDNKITKAYDNNRLYRQYRTQALPENLVLRVNKDEKNESVQRKNIETTSFLQIRSNDYDVIDDQIEKDLEDLEKDETPNLVEEEYKNLNNDALVDNEKLNEQLNQENGDNQMTTDLYID